MGGQVTAAAIVPVIRLRVTGSGVNKLVVKGFLIEGLAQ